MDGGFLSMFDGITVGTVENGWYRDRLPAPAREGARLMETMIEEELTTALSRPRYGRRPHAARSCVTHSNTYLPLTRFPLDVFGRRGARLRRSGVRLCRDPSPSWALSTALEMAWPDKRDVRRTLREHHLLRFWDELLAILAAFCPGFFRRVVRLALRELAR